MIIEETRKENDLERTSIQRLLTAKDVAEILGIAVKTVHKVVREAKLGCVQVTSKERRFTEEQVRRYLSECSVGPKIDKKDPKPVLSHPKKGGDNTESRQEKTKDSWASLKKEMSRWT
jgi:excisionase family DNA binding protein